jgi:hypothetical protein
MPGGGAANGPVKHGAQSRAVAVRATSVKRTILARMGLRQDELSWQAREVLDTYAAVKAKRLALDRYLESAPMVDDNGNVAGCMKLYIAVTNSSIRALEALRATIATLRTGEIDLARALAALDAEEP